MKVYLDACCLARLTDDQTQARVREEAEAVERILGLVRKGVAHWVGSEALLDEIRRNPDERRRLEGHALVALAPK